MVTIDKSFRDQPVDHTHLTQREFSIFIFPSDLNLNKLDSKQPILTHAKKKSSMQQFRRKQHLLRGRYSSGRHCLRAHLIRPLIDRT